MYMMECYLAVQMNACPVTFMGLQGIVLSGIIQRVKDKYEMFSFIIGIQRNKARE